MEASRKTALKLMLKAEKEQAYSNLALNIALKESLLSPKDKAFVSALFYGVLERRLTLDYLIDSYAGKKPLSPEVQGILRMGFYQLLYMDRVPESAAVNEAVNLAKEFRSSRNASGLINAVLRAFIRKGKQLELPASPLEALSIQHSLPTWIIELWRTSYGEELMLELLPCLCGRPPLTVRVNTAKTTSKELMASLASKGIAAVEIDWLSNALEISGTGSIEALDEFKNGWFHVQDAASQLCCKLLDAKPEELIYDVCAAPGGKSFTIAQSGGKISSYDLHPHKIELIKSGAARLGLGNIQASLRNAAEPEQALPLAEKVLCDVPCSGLGIIRRKPEIRYKSPKEIKSLPEIQYKILCESAKLVKPNGLLIYSTCTLNPKENGEVTAKFLNEHPDFAPFSLNLPPNIRRIEEQPHELSLFPQAYGTDGFYVAGFKKEARC
ncbi:MAG: 16S rRNA (cytosine(967)-C(5))-methyltransferase RsmB [Oscillospiraceae bacterium]|jgi:16S rRNA (cytosine967-C5)-methyltransferase|nr:16S rRNA (cytosine(967)-C(5))-methyltransferase RsmB [Oscillospiraceae bacterium]